MQIVNSFADADEFNRQFQFVLDGQHNTAACGTVKFCEYDTRQFRNAHKFTCLIDSILTGSCIQHQQNFTVGIRQFTVNDAVDLCQFVHEVFLIVQTACGIADDDIAISCFACGNGVKNNGGGIGTFFVFDDVNTCTGGPFIKLFDRGGTESIGRTEDDLFAFGFIHGSKFADGGGLTHAVDTDHQQNGRNGDQPHILTAVEHFGNDILQFRFDLIGFFDAFGTNAGTQFFDDRNGSFHADVGHDENFFKFHVQVIGKFVKRVHHIVNGTRHFVSRLGQTEVDFLKNCHLASPFGQVYLMFLFITEGKG